MRTAFRSSVRALLLLGTVLITACASTAEQPTNTPATGAGAGATGSSTLTVDNNDNSFTAVTIFLQPESGGVRQSLGVIESGQTRNFPLPLQRGWYTLVAQRSSGDLRSDRFYVPAAATITWDLALNRVRVVAR